MDLITLNSSGLSCVVVPELGGKIVSLLMKEKQCELVAVPTRPLFPADEEPPSFGRHGIAGLDDCFPNIDAEAIEFTAEELSVPGYKEQCSRRLSYPDHGEIWSRKMRIAEQSADALKLVYDSGAFGYHYEKMYKLCGDQLRLHWEITNTGAQALPCIWTFHGLMRFEKDSELVYPTDIRRFQLVYQLPGPGEMNRMVEYSVSAGPDPAARNESPDADQDLQGGTPTLDRFPQGDTPSCLKFYTPEQVKDGRCSVIHPSDGVRVNISYDADKLPWLGVWIDDNVYGKCRNFAFEMTNGYFDKVSRAKANGKLCILAPGEKLAFQVTIEGEEI
ncbi:MAG: aldose 1-epimerase [Lachnospiraceae bacterium]|nr:aldose 1-epimerase [Lachnospiraceae bacterium]